MRFLNNTRTYFAAFIFTLLAFCPLIAQAQSNQLTALWKEFDQAMDKDLPQTGLKVLEKISKKAESEKAYANLLKAELKKAEITDYLAPDSMEIVTRNLKKKTEQMKSKDRVAYAILNLALYKHTTSEKSYLEEAFADMDLLARTKSEDWSVILNQKNEIDAFNSDMLSVMGYAANQQKRLYDYYKKAGNRRACAWLAQEASVYSDAKKLALLVEEYKDLQEGALIAKRYYEKCQQNNTMTAAERYQLLQTYRKQWAGTKEAEIFEEFEKNWQEGELRIKALPNILPINKEKKLELMAKNVSKAKLCIIPLSVAGRNVPTNSESNINRYYEKLLTQYAVKSGNSYKGQIDIAKDFAIENCYTSAQDSIIIPGLKSGVYMLKLESLDEKDNASYKDPNGFIINKNSSAATDYALLYVSNMKILQLPLPNKKERLVVVDSETGHEIKDAKVFQDKRKGFVAFNSADNGMPYTQIYTSSFYSYAPEKEDFRLNAYLDRGIYRPGQTVQIAAIMHKTTYGVNTSVVPNQKITFRLLDANYQTVTEKQTTTDDFGTASAEFVLPTDRLTGHWQIETSADNCNAYTNFRVEEYKRPTFEVSFNKYEKEYQLGDTIKVKGVAKTYAGVPVANSKVAYTVKREMPWWCWWRGYGLGERLMTDTIVTNDKGEFEAIVPLSIPQQEEGGNYPLNGDLEGLFSCYNYKIEAAVTSISGETREGETVITASNKQLLFKVSVKEKFINTDASGLSVSVRNSAGVEIKDAKLAFKLNKQNKIYASAEEVNAAIKQLPSGKHTIYAEATYKNNVERDTVSFTIFSLDDKKPVEETKHWTYITHRQFKTDDDVITLQLGTSDEDVEIFYDVFVGEEHKESTVLHASNSLIRKDFKPIKGKNILVSYAWVKEGKLYTNHYLLEQAVPEKSLSLTWKTFRNKLLPGQQEEWTLNIQNPRTKTQGNYQLLACLYDKSLDAIASTNWSSWLGMRTGNSSTQWSISNNRISSLSLYRYFKSTTDSRPTMSSFNVWPFTGQFYGNRYKAYDMLMYSRAPGATANGIKAKAHLAAPMALESAEEMAVADEALQEAVMLEEPKPQPEEASPATTSEAKTGLRTNFSETAFFYPQLFADKNGDVYISFTLPESTTTWQFRALAHDKDMNNGMLQDEIIAQKQLMISPNMPRFIRKGDKAVLASVISNLSEKTLNTKTTIEILNPETEKVLYTDSANSTLEAGKTAAVNFNIKTPSNSPTGGGQNLAEGVYIVKIFTESLTHVDSSLPPVGETEGVSVGYSDGEQHYLAVIDNVEPVMTTKSITMIKPGKETVTTASLFPTDATDKKLTVEWTENPAWLMLETLPYMNSQDQTTIYSKAAAYYANALGANILNAMPEKTKQTILHLNETAPVSEALASGSTAASPLEKNPELKTLLLSETPWVMDAKNETERIQMLRNFYDENKLAYNQEQLINKLKAEQNGNGGWSWCPNMETSYWMTSEICELFVRLNNMIGKQEATSDMLKKAMNCLQKKAHDEILEWKKQEKKGSKPYIYDCYALQYVYLKALSGDKLSVQEKSDADFLVKYLKKQERKNSLFMKAKLAIVLHYMGETKMAKEYVQSINEYSAYKELEGRYFDTRRAEYSWRDYKQPTQTMVIEALKAITPNDQQTIAEYQRWLLMQKRTQMWDTPINTVNNVYAFVSPSRSESKNSPKAPVSEASASDYAIINAFSSDGKGYSKNIYVDKNILPIVEFEKTNDQVSWGAVYAQYKQKATNISDYFEGLKITREIISPEGTSLPLVGETEGVSVGSKVKVRITVVADRDYDFVQIVDKRAACLEPVNQTSGYRWGNDGYYETPQDSRTCYYLDILRKGTHTFETEYYIDRAGDYQSGTCTVQCAYAPEYYGRTGAMTIQAK